jgi:hypothetical protein
MVVNPVIFWRVDLVMIVTWMRTCHQLVNKENSYDEDNANDSSDMKHDAWMRVGTERKCFLLSGKPGISVDLEDQNDTLEYVGLFIAPEFAELISREANWYA